MTAPGDRRRLGIYTGIFISVLAAGTIGFSLAEDLTLADALYFTIVTVGTVGYGDIAPHTSAGKALAICIIIGGVGTFVGMLGQATELLLKRREIEQRADKLNMVIGLFFSEAGSRVLRVFASADPGLGGIRETLVVRDEWKPADFAAAREAFAHHPFAVSMDRVDLPGLRDMLNTHGPLVVRLMESPYMLEHEAFTDLLIAILHLKEELLHRDDFAASPQSDRDHLQGDIHRVYRQLGNLWFSYMADLKQGYPFLFSLGMRTNPFREEMMAVVR